ncbi:hypothetical protein MATL_G00216470 [Megalops atlanticus]|uniref:BAH domain-containing protein n=1 Tax=Megalops atlanticus TaxID=7932 RepID=A0A9D3PJE5_MEGAT|nr:hypothetical protein MATL_G00216470 [Megalops atlanticus]
MDGRDCGPPRSVHVPPPLLTGLAMETHRLGPAAPAGRIPPSSGHLGAGHSAPLHTGKYLPSAINLHSHHGDAFPGGSTPFLSGYVSSSNPHGGPAPMTSDPSFRAPNPTNLQMAQLWASHLHEGLSHLPGSLYPSPYIPLGHLEHPSSGSPIHAQLGQHTLFDPQKEGFYLPGHGGQPTLHSQPSLSRTPAAHTPSAVPREREGLPHHKSSKDPAREAGKEKPYKSESNEPLPRSQRDRDRDRLKEESRPRSVVDLTQDVKAEDERRPGGPDRPFKKTSPFFRERSPCSGSGEPKPGPPLQTSSLSNCRSGNGVPSLRSLGAEQDRWPKDPGPDDENTRPGMPLHGDKLKKCDTLVTSGMYPLPPHHLPPSLYPLYPTVREHGREHRVIAPTFVPSVEVYDERHGPIQIASQARDNKNDKNGEKDRQTGGERTVSDTARPPPAHESSSHGENKRTETLREEGSVIRSNSLAVRRPPPSDACLSRSGHSPEATDLVLTSSSSKEMSKMALEAETSSQERDRLQRASLRDSGLTYSGIDPARMQSFSTPEHKWKPFEMDSYAASQMSSLAVQHGQGGRGEEDGKKVYLDSAMSGAPRGSHEGLRSDSPGEVSAMQSLIKYSSSLNKGSGSRPRSDTRSPFGGLGNLKLEGGQPRASKVQHLPPQQPGKQLKRDPERPESAKSFGRESIGSQGEVEVRHPPVGIAVAVARQRDNGSKPSSGLVERDRPLLVGSIKGSSRPEEERGDEGVRHRDDRLLAGRLEREQEKLLRENKELAEYTQMHPPEASASGLNPNLMVTGGPALASSGRWPADPASHLASHPWMPRPGGPSMWLPGSPYGLGHPSLHQGLPPGYPPTLPGSIPPPYQFARDPQSGQLLVIPTEHLPHYAAELMERAPPLWSAVYPPAGGSLQHAQQLQLLSQQQLLRQQELYMIQQQAAQVMELQRSAHFVERFKASEQRAEMEDKAAKRGSDAGKQGLSTTSTPALHSRKPSPRSPTPTTSYEKAMTPLASPVTSLKSEGRPKSDKSLPQQSYSHPSTPAPHPPSPASAPSPLPAPIPPKEECVEVCEEKELDLQKCVSAPLQALYPEAPSGYPYQSLTSPFGSHYPYLLQPAAAADADGLAPDVPLPAETPERSAAAADVKPRRLRSPAVVEPLLASREELPVKEEPGLEDSKDELGPLRSAVPAPVITSRDPRAAATPESCSLGTAVPPEGGAMEEEEEEEEEGRKVKLEEVSVQSCQASYQVPAAGPVSEADSEVPEGSASPVGLDRVPSERAGESQAQSSVLGEPDHPLCQPEEDAVGRELEEPAPEASDSMEATCEAPFLTLTGHPPLPLRPPSPDIAPEDPMAGMIALVAASELPQACPLPTPTDMKESPSDAIALESADMAGMTLLGEVAELELERRRSDFQCMAHCGLESLLLAGRQVLLEALEAKPIVTIRLPRELNPNRKYSWMQKKDEPLFSKVALEGIDAMEVDYRMRLAELQRKYKDRQRELVKLQRRKDREEKQQAEEKSRTLARRGPGRPRKRKHGLCALSPPAGKLDTKCGKFGRSLPVSEDSEAGEVQRKRFRGPSRDEEEEMEGGVVKAKRKSRHWADREASSSFSQEMQIKRSKKRRVSEQEQLATKLDKALSLTKMGKLHKSPFQFAEGVSGKPRSSSGSCSRLSMLHEMELKANSGKQSLSKGLGIFQKSSKGGKNKMAAKAKNMEPCLNVKGQRKVSHSPARSEVSSYSNNTDTEEEEEESMEVWPPRPILGRAGARATGSGLGGKMSKKSSPPPKRGEASGQLYSKRALGKTKHKHFALLLQEAGASSSEDSFDQEYFTEKEDCEDEEEEEEEYDYELGRSDGLCSPSLEESGLGLLARFAASALPSPVVSTPISVVQLEAKQKARKKEERQSLLGTEFEYTDSESDVKIRRKFPSLLHGLRAAPELPLLAPVSTVREEPSSARPRMTERGRKPKARPPRAFSLDTGTEASDEERWTRRRSERIFLHDAAMSTPVSPSTPAPKPARCPKKEAAKPKEVKDTGKVRAVKKKGKESPVSPAPPQLPSPPAESRAAPPCLPVGPGRRSKVKAKPREVKKEARGKGGAVSKLMESMAADEDFEPNQDSSFSEDENVPLSGPPDRPSTPALRNCVIEKEELKDGLRVLIPMDDKLLYAGHVNTVHLPDIYRVVVEGERGNRPHIYCLEQLLQEAIIDVKPPSVKYLPEGTRIAAYWSQQYRCLYPGTVVRGNPDTDEDDDLITVEFDDGDTGRIPLSHIRMLPPDYKIQCAEPSPALLVPSTKRRGRKSSKEASESKEAGSQTSEEPVPKSRRRGRKPKSQPEPEVVLEEREKAEMSAAPEAQETPPSSRRQASRPGRKRQQGNAAGSPDAVPDETQKKTAQVNAAAKVSPQPQALYTPPVYGKVLSVDLYAEPSGSLGSFLSNNGNPGKVKSAKKGRKSEELQEAGPGAKAQRKPPQAEILIKLDHEGVMSPKTKKTKALMMMEDQRLSKRENKAVMGVAYTAVTTEEANQKSSKAKAPEKDSPKTAAVSTYSVRKLGSSGDGVVKVKNAEVNKVEESDSSSSAGSESEGEGRDQEKEKKAQEDTGSSSSRASSPASSNSSSSSTSSSSSSSSSGSTSSSSASSSSSSSSSSTTTDEDSPCSSDEETTGSPPHSSSAPKSPPQAEEKPAVSQKTHAPVLTKGQKRQQPQQKGQKQQGKSRPKRREGIHLPTTKELAKRQRLPSVENRPKISAFLPARQLWKWFGKPTQRRGMKGKAKKLFYKAIVRGKEMIRIGDCAVFLSAGRPNLPYIGRIQSMWESWGNNMVVRVKWFYHPEETNPGKKLHDGKIWDQKSAKGLHAALQASTQRKDFMERALYQSSHIDENDVQTVSHKCLVVSLEQYEQMIKTKKYQDSEDLYYLAGTYEPTTGMIFNTDGVPIIC